MSASDIVILTSIEDTIFIEHTCRDANSDVYLLSSLDGSDHPKARHSIIRMPQGYNSTSMPFPAIIGPFLFLHFAFIADTVPDFQACKLYHWPSGSCVKVRTPHASPASK